MWPASLREVMASPVMCSKLTSDAPCTTWPSSATCSIKVIDGSLACCQRPTSAGSYARTHKTLEVLSQLLLKV